MHAIFVVHCWVDMKPLYRTQPNNLKLCSNQSTNHNSWFGMRGPPKILLTRVPIFADRSLTVTMIEKKYIILPEVESKQNILTKLDSKRSILTDRNNVILFN